MHEEKVLTLSKDENLAIIYLKSAFVKDLKIEIIAKFYVEKVIF